MNLERLTRGVLYSLRDIVFGVEDSVITTLGVVLGVGSSGAPTGEILVAGAAAVIGGLISMGAGEYISTKSQVELLQREVAEERWRLRHEPQREMRELESRYVRRGFSPAEAKHFVRELSRHKKLLLRELLAEELGILPERFDNPARNAVIMSVAYVLGGLVPLLPFLVFSKVSAVSVSVGVSVGVLFLVGVWKTTVTRRPWLRSGLEMLAIGVLAAAAGYAFGSLYPGAG